MTALIALIPYIMFVAWWVFWKEHAYTFKQFRSDFIEGGGADVDKPTITKDNIRRILEALKP